MTGEHHPESPALTESVGAMLKGAREARAVSLEEAARITRIGQPYLNALESDRFELLPSQAYVKGFLRSYASFLGLPAETVVAAYERQVSPPPAPAAQPELEPAERGKERPAPRHGQWILSVVLLILTGIAVVIFDRSNAPPPPEPRQQVVEQPKPAPVQQPLSSAMAPSPVPAATQVTENARKEGEEQRGGIVLKLKVNQDCWLNIRIDDAVSQQYDLKAGDLIEWKGERSFQLDVGNAGGVEAELNGRQLKPFGEPGKPAHILLGPGGEQPQP